MMPIRIERWQPKDNGLSPAGGKIVMRDHPLTQLPLTREGLVLSRRVTEGISGLAGRAPSVEISPANRGVSVRTTEGCRAWVAPIDKADQEPREISTRPVTIPLTGWMVFFDAPDKPQRVALIGSSK
jgi:hypothetical protein